MGQAMKQRHLIAARAVGLLLAASPLLVTAPAWAGPCVTASVATYEASGFFVQRRSGDIQQYCGHHSDKRERNRGLGRV